MTMNRDLFKKLQRMNLAQIKRQMERLEAAEKDAREALRQMGVEEPTEGQVLEVLEFWDKHGRPGNTNDGDGTRKAR